MKIMMTFIVLLALILLAQTQPIQCEANAPARPDKKFSLSDRQLLVPTIYSQLDLITDVNDQIISAKVREQGTWEGMRLRNMARFVKPGNTIINAGTHIGLEAVVLAKLAGPNGKIYALEPSSFIHNILLKNLYINRLGNIAKTFPLACSNKQGQGFVGFNSRFSPRARVENQIGTFKPEEQPQSVKIATIDNLLASESRTVDFALITTGRFEAECLDGMKNVISRSPKMVIVCQWSGISENAEKTSLRKNVLDWLSGSQRKFYTLSQGTQPCGPGKFTQISTQAILSIRENEVKYIWMVPQSVNPSSVN